MSKTKLIAVSGICSATAVVCMILTSIALWAILVLSVVASIAVVIPLLIDPKGLVYSLLIFAVVAVLGSFAAVSIGSIVYVAPMVTFCMPFAIVKVYGESVKVSAKVEQEDTLDDPFEKGEVKIMSMQVKGKKRLPAFVRWILYYVLLEAGIGLTILTSYLLAPTTFTLIVHNKYFYILLGVAQLIVIPFDFLMRGCLIGTVKILRKAIK